MSGTQNSLTVTLTGELPLILLVAAVLALPVSFFLLWLYRRAVLRSMRRRTGAGVPSPPTERMSSPVAGEIALSSAETSGRQELPFDAELLIRQAERGPWRAAAVYCFAGGANAVVLTMGWLLATRDTISIVKFLWLFWVYAWPVALTVNLVAAATRRRKAYLALGYFAVLGILATTALVHGHHLSLRQLILVYWTWTAGVPTALLGAFLVRRIRAVGPLVISFMVVAVTGSQIAVSVTGHNARLMRTVVDLGVRLGLSGTGIFVMLHVTGFVLFALAGWVLLLLVRWGYERKRISDQSLACDSIWFLFGTIQSIQLVFDGWWWIFTGLAGFLLYKVVARAGFSWLRRGPELSAPRLLLLRVFALGKRSDSLFHALGKHWLRTGSVRMIAGPDLATSTVEPHEFLDFLGGKLARRFINGPEDLKLRLQALDTRPDWDGRFRVTDFFCRDDTWKMVLGKLIRESDAVLMDLRGFSSRNAGCRYEIEELLNVAPLPRVVFLTDGTTDAAFLQGVANEGWSRLRGDSPNLQPESRELRIFHLTGSLSDELERLLRWLCVAATNPQAVISGEESTQPDSRGQFLGMPGPLPGSAG